MCNKLVIGIPTYHRQDKCCQLLKEIGSIDGIFDYVEIVVIDNSTKDTVNFFETIQALDFSENITYINNGKNKGLDWSILSLIDIAKDKSAKLWFLCDDDTLKLNEILGFVNFVNSSEYAVNICKFAFQDESISSSLDYGEKVFSVGDKFDYFRTSFLPTVAIDPALVNTEELRPLCGTNYIHIAVVNTLISSYKELNVYLPVVGVQSANPILTFSLRKTFLRGYVKCLNWHRILSLADIKLEARDRCKGYMGVMIKQIFAKDRALIQPLEILKTAAEVFRTLGVINFILLFPRLIVLFFLGILR